MATARELSRNRIVDTASESYPSVGQIISELVHSVRERDMLTYDHSRRVAIYASRIARQTGWQRQDMRDLAYAGLVHDLGKTWIQNAVLHKPSALSTDEREQMQRHPVIAARILQIYAAPEALVENVLHHHEAYDGHGYPSGLTGEAIPLGARILAIADVFDALTSARPYREAMTAEYTRDWIAERAGSHFDPHLVAAFVELLANRSDFLVLPRVETLTPIETPDGWRENTSPKTTRKSLPVGRARR
ncbi:MAG TPA: HD-GYP domain-containing protein [Ktedonobacterales bacterium]